MFAREYADASNLRRVVFRRRGGANSDTLAVCPVCGFGTAQRPFVAWAIGVAKREVLMARRHHARSFLSYQADLLERIGEAYEELAPEFEDRSRALRECLRRVKGRAGELLRLRYEESLKPNAIATRVGIAVVAVRVMLSRTRATLRECIERKLKPQKLRP